MEWEWTQGLLKQCKAAGVPCYPKQVSKNKDGTGKVIHFVPRPGELAWRDE